MTKAEALSKHIEDSWDDLIWTYSDEEKLEFLQELNDKGLLRIDDIFYLEMVEDAINRHFSEEFEGLS